MVSDEFDALEVGNDRPHHERKDAFARELACSGAWCRLELGIAELESEQAKLLGERRPRSRGVVGDEPESMTLATKTSHSLDSAGDRLT